MQQCTLDRAIQCYPTNPTNTLLFMPGTTMEHMSVLVNAKMAAVTWAHPGRRCRQRSLKRGTPAAQHWWMLCGRSLRSNTGLTVTSLQGNATLLRHSQMLHSVVRNHPEAVTNMELMHPPSEVHTCLEIGSTDRIPGSHPSHQPFPCPAV